MINVWRLELQNGLRSRAFSFLKIEELRWRPKTNLVAAFAMDLGLDDR
jgi:hypothetical protein